MEKIEKVKSGRVPEIVCQYERAGERTEGKNFRIITTREDGPRKENLVCFNSLCIEKKGFGENWFPVYDSGRVRYHNCLYFNDNQDASFYSPVILEESEERLVYAYRTGIGNIKVFQLNGETDEPKELNTFDFEEIGEIIKLKPIYFGDFETLQFHVNEKTEWFEEVLGRKSSWSVSFEVFNYGGKKLEKKDEIEEDGDIVILPAARKAYEASRINLYQIFIYVKNKGFGYSGIYCPGFYNREEFNYTSGEEIKVKVINRGKDFLSFSVRITNNRKEWEEVETFRVEWKIK
jgi:hypothetical protein